MTQGSRGARQPVDEIDIHYQAEQITTPDWVPHGVDVSKRHGQPAWVDPELWNDFGTGEQILPSSWLAVMRGADGIGTSGNVPNWPGVNMDSRLGYHGTATVFRSLHRAVDELAVPLKLGRPSNRAWTDNDRNSCSGRRDAAAIHRHRHLRSPARSTDVACDDMDRGRHCDSKPQELAGSEPVHCPFDAGGLFHNTRPSRERSC